MKAGYFVTVFNPRQYSIPIEGHYLCVSELPLPDRSSKNLTDLKVLFVSGLEILDTKYQKLVEIMDVLKTNLGMGYPVQDAIDQLQNQLDDLVIAQETIVRNLVEALTDIMDGIDDELSVLQDISGRLDGDSVPIPLDCVP